MFRTVIFIIVFTLVSECVAAQGPAARWFKGNTHTHTLNSDGDSTPEEVVKWYRDNGYNFLVLTDHEKITPVEPLNTAFGKPGEFVVISGQEITDRAEGKPHHVNALGITTASMPKKAAVSLANLQANVDAVIALGGVPQINHPNFGWALTAETLSKTEGVMLFELFNGHPLVNNMGGGAVHPRLNSYGMQCFRAGGLSTEWPLTMFTRSENSATAPRPPPVTVG